MSANSGETRSIILVTNDLGPRAGGIETFIQGLLDRLNGHDIVIYTSSQPGDAEFDADLEARLGIVVVRDKAKILLPTPRVFRDVARTMQRYGSSIVWFGAAAPLAWMAPMLKKVGAKKIVALTHGHEVWWSKIFPFTIAMRRIGNSCDVITYLGDFTRDAMKGALGRKPELVHIAPGVDINHFTPGEKSVELIEEYNLKGKLVIISVGRLVHRKGQDRLIEAMPAILKAVPNATLLFVGQGPYKAELDKLVAHHKLQNHVQFVGRLTYPQLPEYIRLGDVFAMPSRSRFFGLEVEGLGIVYLEASACGLPVIAGASGGAPDAVLVGQTGYVVDGTNVPEIAEHLIEVLTEENLRVSMGRAGREWTEEVWDWEIWGHKFAELLTHD